MRADSVGLFWQDVQSEGRGRVARIMPPIPETGWLPPREFPNLSAARCLSVDVEAYDPELDNCGPFWGRSQGNKELGHICGFSVGVEEGMRWYFPLRHTIEPEMNMDPVHAFAWLKDVLSINRPMVGANLLYDVGALRSEGIIPAGELYDVQYAESLLEERAKVSLETLARKYLGEGKVVGDLKKWIRDYYNPPETKWRRDIYRAPPRLVGPYGEGDADLPIRLMPILWEKLEREGLVDLFRMECALIPMLVEMRFAGVRVDIPKAEELSSALGKRIETEHARLVSIAGSQVTVNSGASLAKAFDALGLKYPRTEATEGSPNGNPSFVKAFLESVDHPLAKTVLEIRRLEKLKGTFVEGYVLGKNVNGQLYCSFHPLRGDDGGAKSGRFASSDPNLQNVPSRDKELAALVRGVFVPDLGHVAWRKYDYSQIEYRFLVHYAVGPGSDEARAQFTANPDTDYHKWTQALVTKLTGQEIDRKPIKNLNFGIIYGMGEEKLTADLHLPSKAAGKAFLAAYHAGVPFVKPTMKAAHDEAVSTGMIKTILGRRARFDLWESAKWGDSGFPVPYDEAVRKWSKIQRAGIHAALNRRLQGSAADMMKKAMLLLWQSGVFRYTGIPRLTVHDELDFSDPGGVPEAFLEVKRIMENALPMRLPIRAECDIGPDWGHGEPL